MSYGTFDLEITEPLPDLRVDREGVAIAGRRNGRVITFLLKSFPTGTILNRTELADWIAGDIGTVWIQECVRDELWGAAPAGQLPSLTIAICTRDRPASLRRCLLTLLDRREQLDRESPHWEILVVDNCPSDNQTRQIVSQLKAVRYVCEVQPGLNFARNKALREANGEILAYIDDDVVVDRFWVRGLAEAWFANPDAAAITGQVLPLELETEAQVLFELRGGFRHGFEQVRYTRGTPYGDDGFLYPCRTGIFGVGCNMAFRRHILEEIGGFDEALDTGPLLPGGGDHDILYRIIRAGYPLIYEPSCVVFHRHRRGMDELRQQYKTWGLSLMAFASKAYNCDRPMRPIWRKLILLWFVSHFRELLAAVFGRHCLPARFLFWELFGGMTGLCGEYGRSSRRVAKIQQGHR